MTATTPSTRCWSEDVLLYFFRNKVKTYSELISFPAQSVASAVVAPTVAVLVKQIRC
jgi:hypothetical protein